MNKDEYAKLLSEWSSGTFWFWFWMTILTVVIHWSGRLALKLIEVKQ